MNKRELRRACENLLRRELHLSNRFLAPNYTASQWTPASLDMAATYVGLTHAESEALLEFTVASLLAHGAASSAKGYSHPALINATVAYQSILTSKVGVTLIPKRRELEKDSAALQRAWYEAGAADYWDRAVDMNHGTGLAYLERLLHPIGIVIQRKSFSKVEGSGVVALAHAPATLSTDLNEFVSLRGRAVHTSAATFKATAQSRTPQDVGVSGRRASEAIAAVVRLIVSRVW